MRKLIETSQENFIVCDNINCDFKVPNTDSDIPKILKDYLNVPCPKCRHNLLTEKDYNDTIALLKVVNWLNRWFSWVTIFYKKNTKRSGVWVNVHKGINIKK